MNLTRCVAPFATLLCTLLLSFGDTARAGDAPVWIASGLLGGTYRSVYATNLQELLRGYRVLHRESTGSGDNLDLLVAGKARIGFAQADVYAARRSAEPGYLDGLVVVGKLADECIYLAHRKAGPVKAFADLAGPVEGRPVRAALGPETGGMQGTWSHLVSLKPELAAVTVETGTDTLAVNQLAVGAFDVVGWVTDPQNIEHDMLRATLANDALALMDLTDPAIVSALPDGTQVYARRRVKLAEGWRAPKLDTVCTSALLLVRADSDPKLLKKLADLVSLQLDAIVPPRARP